MAGLDCIRESRLKARATNKMLTQLSAGYHAWNGIISGAVQGETVRSPYVGNSRLTLAPSRSPIRPIFLSPASTGDLCSVVLPFQL